MRTRDTMLLSHRMWQAVFFFPEAVFEMDLDTVVVG